jgi:hypothetical protein
MFVLSDDRTIDIEVGYGLEDKLPDAHALCGPYPRERDENVTSSTCRPPSQPPAG